MKIETKHVHAVKSSKSYLLAERITRWMDKYYLDAVLGFLLEGLGDLLTQLLTLPYIYVSAVKIRSVPLTLAVIYNALCDIALGLIPFYVGDVLDVFNKSFVRNFKLIVGFVEGNKKIISEVNSKAVKMGVLIVLLCVLIYFLVLIAMKVMAWLWGVIASLF